jgi:hypothetical protein
MNGRNGEIERHLDVLEALLDRAEAMLGNDAGEDGA